MKPKLILATLILLLASIFVLPTTALAQAKKPNILVIFGDDIGQTNVSAYSIGIMGYRTPNIDRIAKEGMIFTDYYAEQSCTAGRSSFITGQCTLRTGLSKDRPDKVFDHFFSTKQTGMGMGLTIVRSIIETHGGKISAENAPDRGARFFFQLPAARGDSKSQAA
jgi:hypothetical protein